MKTLIILLLFCACVPPQMSVETLTNEDGMEIRFMQDSVAISEWLFIPFGEPVPEYTVHEDENGWLEYRLSRNSVRFNWDWDGAENIARFEYGADGFRDYQKMWEWTAEQSIQPDTTFSWGLSWQITKGREPEVWEALLTGIPKNIYIVFSVRAVTDGGHSTWARSTWEDKPFYLIWEE